MLTTAADDRYIVLQRLRNRRLTAAATGRQYGIHPPTVRNRLRQHSTYSCVPTVLRSNSHLTLLNGKAARRDWCRLHPHFRRADWDLILFSDECRSNLSHDRVYRRRGERFADACVIERDLFGSGSVLVWVGMMGGNKTGLKSLFMETLMLRLT